MLVVCYNVPVNIVFILDEKVTLQENGIRSSIKTDEYNF
jgi:hypothetical protein